MSVQYEDSYQSDFSFRNRIVWMSVQYEDSYQSDFSFRNRIQ